MSESQPARCWSDFCIASKHPGHNDHVDATGYTWHEYPPANHPDASTGPPETNPWFPKDKGNIDE